MQQSTLIIGAGVQSSAIPSTYDAMDSDTAVKASYEAEGYDDSQINANLGSVNLVADRWSDKMCLIQSRNDRSDDTGKLCVNKSFEFGVVNTVVGEFAANGIVGLAPSRSSQSFVNALWE